MRLCISSFWLIVVEMGLCVRQAQALFSTRAYHCSSSQRVLSVTCGIWDLDPDQEIQPGHPEPGARSPLDPREVSGGTGSAAITSPWGAALSGVDPLSTAPGCCLRQTLRRGPSAAVPRTRSQPSTAAPQALCRAGRAVPGPAVFMEPSRHSCAAWGPCVVASAHRGRLSSRLQLWRWGRPWPGSHCAVVKGLGSWGGPLRDTRHHGAREGLSRLPHRDLCNRKLGKVRHPAHLVSGWARSAVRVRGLGRLGFCVSAARAV